MWLQVYSIDSGAALLPIFLLCWSTDATEWLTIPKLILLFHAFGFLPKLFLLPRTTPALPCQPGEHQPAFQYPEHVYLPGRINISFSAPTVLYTGFYQPADNLFLHYKLQQICTPVPPLWFLQGQEQGFIYFWVPRAWNSEETKIFVELVGSWSQFINQEIDFKIGLSVATQLTLQVYRTRVSWLQFV